MSPPLREGNRAAHPLGSPACRGNHKEGFAFVRVFAKYAQALRISLTPAFLALTLAFTLLACAPSQRLTEQQRLEVFQFVWEEVRRSHYDPKLGGVDWDAVREAYLPKARAAEGDAAFYAVLNEMLGELKQSHFGVIPPGAFVAQEEARQRVGGGEVGVTVQLVEGKPVVVRVRDGSPAARMGIPAGRGTACHRRHTCRSHPATHPRTQPARSGGTLRSVLGVPRVPERARRQHGRFALPRLGRR
jgi:hypothetical protein